MILIHINSSILCCVISSHFILYIQFYAFKYYLLFVSFMLFFLILFFTLFLFFCIKDFHILFNKFFSYKNFYSQFLSRETTNPVPFDSEPSLPVCVVYESLDDFPYSSSLLGMRLLFAFIMFYYISILSYFWLLCVYIHS